MKIFETSAQFLNLIFRENARNFKMRRQIFPLLRQISLKTLTFCMCKFHGNHERTTRYTKRWQQRGYLPCERKMVPESLLKETE